MVVAVILGNRINDDGSITDKMIERLELAIRLNEEHNPDKIILSGGYANKRVNVAESEVMYNYLINKGIPSDKLIKETQSLTTLQNARYSVKIAKELQADTIILSSSIEHINRLLLNPARLFRRQIGRSNIELIVYTNN